APVLGDVEEFRQPGIFVTAQRRIDRVIGNDPRLLGVVTDAAQRTLGMLTRLSDAQMDAIGRHLTPLLSRLALHRVRAPAEHRLAGGGGFVEAAARRADRSLAETRGVA